MSALLHVLMIGFAIMDVKERIEDVASGKNPHAEAIWFRK
jgi:hypothetical protein